VNTGWTLRIFNWATV